MTARVALCGGVLPAAASHGVAWRLQVRKGKADDMDDAMRKIAAGGGKGCCRGCSNPNAGYTGKLNHKRHLRAAKAVMMFGRK